MSVNIPQSVVDPFFRYQRPKINLTNQRLFQQIDNLEIIAKSIYLEPKTIMKYLQKHLGCKTKGDLIFSKKITASEVDDVLETLIEKIICDNCNNPEIVFSNEGKKKKIKIIKTCQACGGMTEIHKDEELKKILNL